MARWVALLQGINLGKRIVSMEDLRRIFGDLGYTNVTTYIRSGNVVFDADGPVSAVAITRELRTHYSFEILVTVRGARDLRRTVSANPFPDVAATTLHVGFFGSRPRENDFADLQPDAAAPERWSVVGSEIYLHLPEGFAHARLPALVGRRVTLVTFRNWNTVTKLVALAANP